MNIPNSFYKNRGLYINDRYGKYTPPSPPIHIYVVYGDDDVYYDGIQVTFDSYIPTPTPEENYVYYGSDGVLYENDEIIYI